MFSNKTIQIDFILLIFLISFKPFDSIGQLDSTVSFCENGYRFELNYRTAVSYFYSEKDSIQYYCNVGIRNIANYQHLKNNIVDSLGKYIYGDSIIIGNNNFEFYHVLEIIEQDPKNEKVKIYSNLNEQLKYKMKMYHKTEYGTSGIGGLVTQFRKIIDRKRRFIIYEDVMVVGLPC